MAKTNKAKLKRGERIKLRAEKRENLDKKTCPICGNQLNFLSKTGRKLKSNKVFCSQKCHDAAKYVDYSTPKELEHIRENGFSFYRKKQIKRKLDLVLIFGGKCSICGYDKNLAALEFHHKDKTQKEFELKMNNFVGNYSDDEIIEEALKCELICSNCHREHHSPYLNVENIKNYFYTDNVIEQ